MIRITQWKPDTCDCVIQLSWDDAVPVDSIVHTMASIKKCSIHDPLADADAYAAVKDENTTKNVVLGHIHENHSDIVDVNIDGSKSLKEGIVYDWSFDQSRKLQVDVKGVDKATAQAIAVTISSELGIGKVDVKIP